MHRKRIMYQEDDFLLLSGIQHFAFCRRQWALIHVEQQWAENQRTAEGKVLHEKAHQAGAEKRGDLLILRGLQISSPILGIAGICDVVEFYSDEDGVALSGRKGKWRPYPVEYKRGKPKADPADKLQLLAQAMCLEEMLCCHIPEGALFYGETRRRQPVQFTQVMRQEVRDMFKEMHAYMRRGYTPNVKRSKKCTACSLQDLCLPRIGHIRSAKAYVEARLKEESPA